jgi:phage recombination protein Bet
MGAVVRLAQLGTYTDRQLDLIRRTVANDCNPAEFDLFCEVAQRTGLDPFRKQISAIVFNKDDPNYRKMAIITTIDGLRAIAARSKRYRPDDEEYDLVCDQELKDPESNPLGIEKVRVRIYVRDEGGVEWRRVTGVARWAEFAPLREDCAAGFEWEDTGEKYPAGHKKAGKPKYRKVPKGETKLVLDKSGNWAKMPSLMIAKCAEAQAIRKAFPEDTSGLYEGAELDRAREEELTASERIEAFSMEHRLERAGIINTIMMSLSPAAGIDAVPIGAIYDRVMEQLRTCDLRWMDWFESTNTAPLREYWARAKSDALALKKQLEARRAELVRAAADEDVTDVEFTDVETEA